MSTVNLWINFNDMFHSGNDLGPYGGFWGFGRILFVTRIKVSRCCNVPGMSTGNLWIIFNDMIDSGNDLGPYGGFWGFGRILCVTQIQVTRCCNVLGFFSHHMSSGSLLS